MMQITIDDLSGREIAEFLEEHIEEMKSISPPESKHALDLEALQQSDITFWTIRDEQAIAGCGALKELAPSHGEIKSMRTSSKFKKRGIASRLLEHIMTEAKQRGYKRLSLETGSMEYFEPARRLYKKFGFDYCPPFAEYIKDPNSVFMTKILES